MVNSLYILALLHCLDGIEHILTLVLLTVERIGSHDVCVHVDDI